MRQLRLRFTEEEEGEEEGAGSVHALHALHVCRVGSLHACNAV